MSETIIWPIYLDSNKSLKDGRKVAMEYAIENPKIRELEKAAKKLKYTYTLEENKSYPGEWYNNSGRMLVEVPIPKKNILISLSEEIIKIRESKSNKNNNRNKNRRNKKK